MVDALPGRVTPDRPVRAPRTGRSSAVLLALLGVTYWATHTMLRPLVGPYVLAGGGSEQQASLALASFAVLPTLLAIPLGSLTDRWGVRSLLVAGGTTMAVGGALLFLPYGLPAVIASQAVIGVGTLAVWVSLQTVATMPLDGEESTRSRNGRLATFSLFLAAGQAIGPALGTGLAEVGGYRTSFLAYTLLSLVLVGLSLAVRSRPRGARLPVLRSYGDAGRMMRVPAVTATLVVSFTALVVLDIRTAYHPLILGQEGVPQWQVGVLLSTAAVFGFLSRPVFPATMARLRESTVVAVVLLVSSASCIAVAFVPPELWLLALLSAVNGFALGFAQPLTLSLMADHTPADRRGLASGLRSTANRGAQLVNPALFGALTAAVPLVGAFGVVGGMLLVTSVGSTWALRRSARHVTVPAQVEEPVVSAGRR